MNIFLIILLVIALIGLLIRILWVYELYTPKLLHEKEKDVVEAISDWLDLLTEEKKFNGAILIVDRGEALLRKAVGFTSYLKKEKLHLHSRFRLASVSKQFTAFGIMVLIKKHDLSYDTRVTQIIPDFPYPKVTIRHLLNQTSGIRADYIKLAKKKKKTASYVLSLKDAVELLCQYPDHIIKNPLEEYYYNNTNYIVLARIIEIVSKHSFEKYMKHVIFQPLGLEETRVWNLLSEADEHFEKDKAKGFEAFLKSKPIEITPNWIDGVAGDGAVFSSISDMEKWSAIWTKNNLLNSSEMKEAFIAPVLANGSPSNYGFGWVLAGDVSWHNGSWLASNSLILKNHKTNACVVVLDNSTNMRFDKITKSILKTLNQKMT
ncbi:serine hydrolase [Aquimarina sp. TRL1]|uniref:serine hydrolase domain-containing protein n=1 Tax=Aquimarina sp. (strain TRL1) TaxID=2736252 RepID=UPI00158C0357|nr:serine hydrolase [Aquimarina sp. TRL1]QKX06713.1 serine hydrolase [Aquimarina sp. TRL1]